jgi:hypothetical protein
MFGKYCTHEYDYNGPAYKPTNLLKDEVYKVGYYRNQGRPGKEDGTEEGIRTIDSKNITYEWYNDHNYAFVNSTRSIGNNYFIIMKKLVLDGFSNKHLDSIMFSFAANDSMDKVNFIIGGLYLYRGSGDSFYLRRTTGNFVIYPIGHLILALVV